MIIAYVGQLDFQPQEITTENKALIQDATWIDLISPSKDEEHLVEKILSLDIPTREEMREIEPSNRLYKENDAIFMTATMVAKSDSPEPRSDAVTFIIKENKLITLRYIEPQAFALFISRFSKGSIENQQATWLIIELLEAVVDRLADIFENVGRSFDEYSQMIFRSDPDPKSNIRIDYKYILQKIGSNGDLNTKAWESLVSFNRLNVFFTRVYSSKLDEEMQSRLESLAKDMKALSDHVKFLTTKVNFLLDATLGMVNIEQNNIIKIFSIVSVILLPPTLIASIYGMNFDFMPELKWPFGYPFSIVLMFISSWLPYQYFKRKKWL